MGEAVGVIWIGNPVIIRAKSGWAPDAEFIHSARVILKKKIEILMRIFMIFYFLFLEFTQCIWRMPLRLAEPTLMVTDCAAKLRSSELKKSKKSKNSKISKNLINFFNSQHALPRCDRPSCAQNRSRALWLRLIRPIDKIISYKRKSRVTGDWEAI